MHWGRSRLGDGPTTQSIMVRRQAVHDEDVAGDDGGMRCRILQPDVHTGGTSGVVEGVGAAW
jgi:hypothetical protein